LAPTQEAVYGRSPEENPFGGSVSGIVGHVPESESKVHLHGAVSDREYDDGRGFEQVDQLFIDPVECIDCGACVPVCPVSAIFALDDLPEKWHAYIEKNANYVTGGKFQADTYKAA
jgi:NAD-dependent dihydropyrimidine dehydrogenase PreA subunit